MNQDYIIHIDRYFLKFKPILDYVISIFIILFSIIGFSICILVIKNIIKDIFKK